MSRRELSSSEMVAVIDALDILEDNLECPAVRDDRKHVLELYHVSIELLKRGGRGVEAAALSHAVLMILEGREEQLLNALKWCSMPIIEASDPWPEATTITANDILPSLEPSLN